MCRRWCKRADGIRRQVGARKAVRPQMREQTPPCGHVGEQRFDVDAQARRAKVSELLSALAEQVHSAVPVVSLHVDEAGGHLDEAVVEIPQRAALVAPKVL